MPNDLPPWPAVHQQTQRWIKAGCFETLVHDLREVLRVAAGKQPRATAAIIDSRTIQSTPSSGARAGYDGAKRRKASKVHAALGTLGHLLALRASAANEQNRAQLGALAAEVQAATGEQVELAYGDQGYSGAEPAKQASSHGIKLEVVKLDQAKRGFVLLPRRWVLERSFGWAARFRWLARDYERLSSSLAGLHWLAFVCLMLRNLFPPSS
jgi:transposase